MAMNAKEALENAHQIEGFEQITAADLRHDEDALDTWFSSWLWPVSLFDGINNPGNEEISYYYPTADLVTGPDIIFFWVARMIMAGEEYVKDVPFRNVYFTGIVRDKLGRKMSKQLGNSPDPIGLIEKYGADGVRMGMMLSAPAGNDILFDESLCEQGRNFCNKIWNAFRLVKGWSVGQQAQPEANAKAVAWMEAMIKTTAAEIQELFGKYRLSEALMAAFKLFTDEFSGWYLEMVKPAYQQPIDQATLDATMQMFEQLMKIIHPFMPFITEELWQQLTPRKEGDSIMVNPLHTASLSDEERGLMHVMEQAKQIISNVRAIRNTKNIAQKEPLSLQVISSAADSRQASRQMADIITKMANLTGIAYTEKKSEGSQSFLIGTSEYAVPLGNLIDAAAEIAKAETEIARLRGFMVGIQKKLSNERFVNNAPAAVVELERKKLSDAESKIATLQQTIDGLK